MTIFIQIAAYRDPELGPTIQNCLSMARWPNELRFGICLQDGPDADQSRDQNVDHRLDNILDHADARFRVTRFDWRESRGVCWARRHTQSLYDGEDFTLQIDSHHRFKKHWDQTLLDCLDACGSSRPIISTYPGAYDPQTNLKQHSAPMKIVANRFDIHGHLRTYPIGFSHLDYSKPLPARFLAAGFLFTLGRFCEDIPYDPNLYFAGEELSLVLRSFTHGYDIFHPAQQVLWHEYRRANKPKHWDDHRKDTSLESGINKISDLDNQRDARRLAALIGDQGDTSNLALSDLENFGLGNRRSIHDFELFAGLDLKNRLLHKSARLGLNPSIMTEERWQLENSLALALKQRNRLWHVRIDSAFHAAQSEQDNFRTFVVSVFDHDDKLLSRQPVAKRLIQPEEAHRFEFKNPNAPKRWVLSGLDAHNKWCNISRGQIFDYRLMD